MSRIALQRDQPVVPRAKTHRASPHGIQREALGTLAAFVALFLIDAAAFRTRLYTSVLDPDSTTGQMETTCALEMERKPQRKKQILAFGDSRMGFQPVLANQVSASQDYEFSTVAIPGTSPRCWCYQLRDLDPDARRYAALLLPVESFDDEDPEDDPADATVDLHYLVARLRLADVFDFSASFPTWPSRWLALRGSLFKGTVYKADLHAFLLDPDGRRAKVRLYASEAGAWRRDFVGTSRDLEGLSVDWTARKITFPANLPSEERKMLENVLLRPPAPQARRLAAYHREWFGRIVDRYRGTGTRLIFFRLPRGPILRPDSNAASRSSSIREFASSRNVVLLDEHTFDVLERPEFFRDPFHLDAKGIALFSKILTDRVIESLQPPVQSGF